MLSGRNDAAARMDHWSEAAGLFAQQPSALPGSEAHEGADQATKEAVHAEIAGHGHQAKAGLAVADDRLMIQRLVAEVEIARAEPAALVAEAAPQDARQFSPGMGMLEHMRAGVRLSRNARDFDGPGNSIGRMLTPGATRRRRPMR